MSAQQAMLDLLVMAEEMTRRGDDAPELKTCQAYGSEIKRLVGELESLRKHDLDSVIKLSLQVERNKVINKFYDKRIHAFFRVLNNIIGYADNLERAKSLCRDAMKDDDDITGKLRVELERFKQHFNA